MLKISRDESLNRTETHHRSSYLNDLQQETVHIDNIKLIFFKLLY